MQPSSRGGGSRGGEAAAGLHLSRCSRPRCCCPLRREDETAFVAATSRVKHFVGEAARHVQPLAPDIGRSGAERHTGTQG
eukprot:scaffold14584_cov72-Phaeocystis_antarctica.AAC.1